MVGMVGFVSDRFAGAMARLAALPDSRCAEPWEWPGHSGWPLQVRDALYRCLEEELEAAAAEAAPGSEAARLLAVGQRAWGELRGLLLGVPDAVLDLAPTGQIGEPEAAAAEDAGEWTLRQVLEHVLLVERRYRGQVLYALQRSDSEPLRKELRVQLTEEEQEGGIDDWIARLAAERAATSELGVITAQQLLRPTVWAGYEVDVRFRMLRFAGHLIEHTVQAEKVLATTGWEAGEAHMVVRRISAARGAHELSTSPQRLARLDAVHDERAISLAGDGDLVTSDH
jgi:DinB superfamily